MMTVKTTPSQRRSFYVRSLKGEPYQEIAAANGLSRECVRYWCRRQRDGGSSESQYYRGSAGLLSRFEPKVRYVILRLRLEHPRWGPSRLRYHLGKRPALKGLKLPSERQISRYLQQWPIFRRRRKKKASKRKRPQVATRVHQRWQVDFKMGIPLQDGSQVNLHTVRDPVGAVCIAACVTPAGIAGQPAKRVTLTELQTTLRAGFIRWGTLPEEVQTDGEALFIGKADDAFPTKFTLWLVGLGITHLVSRPGKPTDNAEVERCHRTIDEYTILGHQHLSASDLQGVLDQALTELAFDLPSYAHGCAGQAPVVAHPQLLTQPRPFQHHHELALFALPQVDAYLSHFTWSRKVSKTGQISIGSHLARYSVGRAYARQVVLVRFDPLDHHFVFYPQDDPTREIGRRPVRGFDVTDITGLAPTSPDFVPQQLPLDLIFPDPQEVCC